MSKFLRTLVLMVALGSFTSASVGCYGKYALTQKVHSWNGSIGNKFVRSIVHFLMVVVPIYGLCAFADFLVLNNIEFLTGSSLIAAAPDEKSVVKKKGNELHVKQGKKHFVVRPTAGEGFSLLLEGQEVGQGKVNADGSMTFTQLSTGKTRVFSAEQVKALQQKQRTSQSMVAGAPQPTL